MRTHLFDNEKLGSLLGGILPESRAWISDAAEVFQNTDSDPIKLMVLFSKAANEVKGGNHLEFNQLQQTHFKGNLILWNLNLYGAIDLARALFLLMLPEGRVEPFYRKLQEFGSYEEQTFALKLLPFLLDGEALSPVVVNFLRANVQPVFEAIAINNPYPLFYFSEDAFNQMVLKTAFIGLDIKDIAGLTYRINPDLIAMMENYIKERKAAGRTVHPSILDLVFGQI